MTRHQFACDRVGALSHVRAGIKAALAGSPHVCDAANGLPPELRSLLEQALEAAELALGHAIVERDAASREVYA